ncbi:hypothetical protein MASR2M15_14700 [Anaerolineales bacterium]
MRGSGYKRIIAQSLGGWKRDENRETKCAAKINKADLVDRRADSVGSGAGLGVPGFATYFHD